MIKQKEKSLSLVKEIEEALNTNKNLNSPDFPSRTELGMTSFTFKDRSVEKDLKDQINGSFKSLAIQTIQTLTSLKSDSGGKSGTKEGKLMKLTDENNKNTYEHPKKTYENPNKTFEYSLNSKKTYENSINSKKTYEHSINPKEKTYESSINPKRTLVFDKKDVFFQYI